VTREEFIKDFRSMGYGHTFHAEAYVTAHPKDSYDTDDIIACTREFKFCLSIDTTLADRKTAKLFAEGDDDGWIPRRSARNNRNVDPLDEINRIYADCERRGI
jgi:hypothetical protein